MSGCLVLAYETDGVVAERHGVRIYHHDTFRGRFLVTLRGARRGERVVDRQVANAVWRLSRGEAVDNDHPAAPGDGEPARPGPTGKGEGDGPDEIRRRFPKDLRAVVGGRRPGTAAAARGGMERRPAGRAFRAAAERDQVPARQAQRGLIVRRATAKRGLGRRSQRDWPACSPREAGLRPLLVCGCGAQACWCRLRLPEPWDAKRSKVCGASSGFGAVRLAESDDRRSQRLKDEVREGLELILGIGPARD